MTELPTKTVAQEFLDSLAALADDDWVIGRHGLRGTYRKREIMRGLTMGAVKVRPDGFRMDPSYYTAWQDWMSNEDHRSGPISDATREKVRARMLRYGIPVPLPAKGRGLTEVIDIEGF